MSFLRTSSSLRLSRACIQIPRSTRCLSQTSQRRIGEPDPKAIANARSTQPTEDQASLVEIDHQPESSIETYHPEHQPDYNATIDHGTSTYSPVPKRVMNGSEPTETTPAAVLSGAPIDLQARTVRSAFPLFPSHTLKVATNMTFVEFPNQSNPLRSLEPGAVTCGVWTGTCWAKVTDGRILSWAGNRPEISCRARTSSSSRKKMPSLLPRSRATSGMSKSRMRDESYPRRTRTTSYTSRAH